MEMNNRLDYKKNFACIGKGVIDVKKVRVYHRFWGRLLPARIKLNWNDEDAMPFVLYWDEKRRIVFGSSDERQPDLFTKIELIRFHYPDICFMGRLWKDRKFIVLDNFYDRNIMSLDTYISDFLEIASHYVEGIDEYNLLFKESEWCDDIYMDSIKNVHDKCLSSIHIRNNCFMNSGTHKLKRLHKK